jgi:cytochrome c biogenesis protein CcmG, thiol:disulfide interchange protein DsbE
MSSAAPSRSTGPIVLVVVGVVVVGAFVAAFVVLGGGGDDLPATAEVSVTGEALPQWQGNPGHDPALGTPAPVIEGTDFGGSPVRAPGEARPTVVLFLAHWCPVCQDEVPVVQQLIEAGEQPDGVALVAVSTGVDPSRPNYPPGAWLRDERWSVPTIVDSAAGEAADAYGLHAFPYWAFVDQTGAVRGRHAGRLTADDLASVMEELRAFD